MATYSLDKPRDRSIQSELENRVDMVDGNLRQLANDASISYFGEERASTMPPIATPVNPMFKFLSIMSRCLDKAAVSGVDPRVMALFQDSSSGLVRSELEALEPSYVPIPTSLLEGDGESPGLRRVLDYYCSCKYAGCSVEYGPISGRFYPVPIPGTDLPVVRYHPQDPTVIVRVEWACRLDVDGYPKDVRKCWDITDLENPVFSINLVSEKGEYKDISENYGEETKRGAAYPWRLSPDAKNPKGRPFIPVVIWGRPSDVWRLQWLTDAVKQDLVKRLAVTQVYIDCGAPTRNVVAATPIVTANGSNKQLQSSLNRGDTQLWKLDHENPERFQHWTDPPGGDPVAMTQGIHLDESDMLSQLGVPVNMSSTGGAPLPEEMEAQREASQRYADAMRGGLYQFFAEVSAMANRMELVQPPAAESGFTFLLGSEVEEALEKAEKAKEMETSANANRPETSPQTRKQETPSPDEIPDRSEDPTED